MNETGIASFPELANLRPNEAVRMVLKRHWIVLVHTGFYLLFLIVSTLALFYFRDAFPLGIPASVVEMLTVSYASVFLLFIYVDWISNELD